MAQRRFAPLDADGGDVPALKGIVFDVDGTLWQVTALHGIEIWPLRTSVRIS